MRYDIRLFEPRTDVAAVAELCGIVWGNDTTTDWEEQVDWAYVRCPSPLPILLAVAPTGTLIGVRGGIRWPLVEYGSIGSSAIDGVQVGGTAVHPEWRRQGIFSKLTREYLDVLAGEGVDLIFNISVPAAMEGYQKLGWEYRRDLVSMIRPSGLTVKTRLGDREEDKISWITGEQERSAVGTLPHIRPEYDESFCKWRLSRTDRRYAFGGSSAKVPYTIHIRRGIRIIEFGIMADSVSSRDLSLCARREYAMLMMYRTTVGSPGWKAAVRRFFVPVRRLRLGQRMLNNRGLEVALKLDIQGVDIDTF
jgi:GNAT superfamily N-acetyltransferase